MTIRLTGAKKAAILLLSMGEDAASDVLKNLSDEDITEITRAMRSFDGVSQNEVQRVANEYFLLAEKGRFLPASPETKTTYLRKIFSRALGEEEAERIVQGMLATEGAGPLEKLQWHDPVTIAEFVSGEHPQVIAVILANLGDPALTQQVLDALPSELSEDVLSRLLQIREVSGEWIEEIEKSLGEEMVEPSPQASSQPQRGGSQQVAGMMNAASPEMEHAIMGHIERQDVELAASIREKMFPFEAFLRVDNMSIQKVVEKATNQDLVHALATAEEPLRRHFFRNLSPDNVKALTEAIANQGPIRVSAIESAQKRLSNIARELAVKGELRLLQRKK